MTASEKDKATEQAETTGEQERDNDAQRPDGSGALRMTPPPRRKRARRVSTAPEAGRACNRQGSSDLTHQEPTCAAHHNPHHAGA